MRSNMKQAGRSGMGEGRKITIPVTGMSCAACARRVEKALSKTAGVSGVNANFATEKANVEYDPDVVNLGVLIGAVEDAGYGTEVRETSLEVSGMTCASCVSRVEKALRKVPGVLDASVNLSTERVRVEYLPGVVEKDLECAVEGAGYGVVRKEGRAKENAHESEYEKLRGRFLGAAALTGLILLGSLPMMFGFMSPVPIWWLNLGLLALATPVQFWAGWRFYEGAWGALKHGQANMNTLVAVGTSTAYLYSVVATLAPGLFAGRGERLLRYLVTHRHAHPPG